MREWVDLDVLRRCHTGGLTSNFAPGVGKLTVFNTWLVLSSPLCPGGGGGAWLQMTEELMLYKGRRSCTPSVYSLFKFQSKFMFCKCKTVFLLQYFKILTE